MASVKRFPETTAILWKGLLKSRGIEIEAGKLKRSPSKTSDKKPATRSESPVPKNQPCTGSSAQGSTLTAAFKRTKSFAVKSEPSGDSVSSKPPQRVRSTPATTSAPEVGPSTLKPSSSKIPEPIPEGERNLFSGKRLKLLGDANDPKVADAIRSRGGTVLTGEDDVDNDEVDFKIVRLAR